MIWDNYSLQLQIIILSIIASILWVLLSRVVNRIISEATKDLTTQYSRIPTRDHRVEANRPILQGLYMLLIVTVLVALVMWIIPWLAVQTWLLVSPYIETSVIQAVGYYLLTLMGAAILYIFSLSKGFVGAREFITKRIPGQSDVFYDWFDFILVVVTGSIVGTVCFSPVTPMAALAAGLGWVGALNTLTGKS